MLGSDEPQGGVIHLNVIATPPPEPELRNIDITEVYHWQWVINKE